MSIASACVQVRMVGDLGRHPSAASLVKREEQLVAVHSGADLHGRCECEEEIGCLTSFDASDLDSN